MMVRREALAAAVSLLVAGLPNRADAAEACDERVAFIEHRVETGAKLSRSWALGWGLGLGALSIGQLAISPAVDGQERIDFHVGGAAAGVGVLTRAVFIPRVILHRSRMRRSPQAGPPAPGCRNSKQSSKRTPSGNTRARACSCTG